MRNKLLFASLSLSLVGCATNVDPDVNIRDTAQRIVPTTIHTSRSLMVTEMEILEKFSLHETLAKLIADSGSNQEPHEVFMNWAESRQDCGPFNGFPVPCQDPGSEFDLLETPNNPSLDRYRAIALLNRFDKADKNGADCGEYRIAFHDLRDIQPRFTQENFFIFEARLPNPAPEIGLEGCRPVVDFWAQLSTIDDNETRGNAIHDFFFEGVNGLPPAIHLSHLAGGEVGSGQIRLNAQMDGSTWSFMEFRAEANCQGSCSLDVVRTTAKEAPFGALSGDEHQLSNTFQESVLASLSTPGEALLADSMSDLSVALPNEVNVGKMDQNIILPRPLLENTSPAFRARLAEQLAEVNSNLSPEQVMNRVHVLSCVGCHQSTGDLGEGLSLPSVTFEFLSSGGTVEGIDGPRLAPKNALRDVFLPERKAKMEAFLQSRPTHCIERPLSPIAAASSSDESAQLSAAAAIDQDWGTRWSSSFSDPQSLTLDLGSVQQVSRVKLHWEAAASALYLIEVSETGAPDSWQQIFSESNGNGGVDVIDSLDARARFVRLTSLARTTQWGNSLWEFEVFGDPNSACEQEVSSELPIAPVLLQSQDYSRAVELGAGNQGAAGSPECDRGDDVDLESTSDNGGICNVGWTEPGESLEYDLFFPEARQWQITLRVASGVSGRQVRLEAGNGAHLGSATVSQKGWQDFEDLSFTASFPAGANSLRIVFPDGGVNLNYLQVQ